MPVSETFCKFRQSARYDDIVQIETTVAYMKKASIRFDYAISRKEPRELLAEGYTVHAFVDKTGKIQRAPGEIVAKVNELLDSSTRAKQ